MRAQDEAAIVACIPSLRRYARVLVGDRDRADDLVQDTLERVWSSFSMWQKRSNIRAWMFGIMHHRFIDDLRAQQNRPEDYASDTLPDLPQRPLQTDALELHDLDKALQRLPTSHREVLLLVGVEELRYEEIATILGVPIGTVMSRLSRARASLREELQGRITPPTKIQRVK